GDAMADGLVEVGSGGWAARGRRAPLEVAPGQIARSREDERPGRAPAIASLAVAGEAEAIVERGTARGPVGVGPSGGGRRRPGRGRRDGGGLAPGRRRDGDGDEGDD